MGPKKGPEWIQTGPNVALLGGDPKNSAGDLTVVRDDIGYSESDALGERKHQQKRLDRRGKEGGIELCKDAGTEAVNALSQPNGKT